MQPYFIGPHLLTFTHARDKGGYQKEAGPLRAGQASHHKGHSALILSHDANSRVRKKLHPVVVLIAVPFSCLFLFIGAIHPVAIEARYDQGQE
jgi:hypothetical protein